MTSEAFVHLHVHSEFSLANGIVRLPDLIANSKSMGMPSVALTDLVNFYGLVKFYSGAKKKGIKPVFGVDLWVHNEEKPSEPFKLILLVQNAAGYKNACVLISKSYQQGQEYEKACVRKEWLHAHSEGLIALSGGMHGEVGQALMSQDQDMILRIVTEYKSLFAGRFYIELHRTNKPYQAEYIDAAMQCAQHYQLPVVATNEVHFINESDFDSHEARICIHQGRTITDPRRTKEFTPEQYLKSPEQMIELFSDIPSAIANTVEIAKRCNLELAMDDYYLPEFPIPQGETIESHLRNESLKGLERVLLRLGADKVEANRDEYMQRMDFELGIINQMGFPGYFLIVADFIQWSKENDIPVGPGRGSGAGSIVAYALGITDLDPIEYDLLFERFLNPERVSMPDFDVDFCVEGRDRVIDYVSRKYGREKVSQIITYGTMAAKAVVRDVGRVLSMPYGFVDKIAKLIPFDLGITLDKALAQEEELQRRYDTEDEVTHLIDLAKSLEGISRNVGKHAGGVVIAPSDLTDFTPLYCEDNNASIVSQYDKDDLEEVGLVKFDFLGLKTLTIIDAAMKDINQKRQQQGLEPIDISTLPYDDPEVYKFLQTGQSTALFQLESSGMKKLIIDLQPEVFEEITALLALYRPGPLGANMEKTFCNRKHGREPVVYDHPILEPILKPTYGVILYQEQVMQIAQFMAGYTLGGADLLRRAMGKKKVEEMTKQREIFLAGAAKQDIDEEVANKVFGLMEYFAEYGFNKSHSAAYAVVSYQTTWIKNYYATEFLASCMSADMDHTDKVVILLNEADNMGLTVLPPNINQCDYRFRALDTKRIVYGLGAVKGIGEAVIEHLIEVRESGGPYEDMFDLCNRIDIKKVNKRAFESLIKAGAFDDFGAHRASLLASIKIAIEAANQRASSMAAGQNELFSVAAPVETVSQLNEVDEWQKNELLSYEKDTLGLYLSGHPIDIYLPEVRQIASTPLVDISVDSNNNKKAVTMAGLMVGFSVKNTNRGKMAFVTLDDKSARLDVTLYAETLEQYEDIIRKDEVLIIKGIASMNSFTGETRIVGNDVYSIDTVRTTLAKQLQLNLTSSQMTPEFMAELKGIIQAQPDANCSVKIVYQSSHGQVDLVSNGSMQISPNGKMLEDLEVLLGAEGVSLHY
ncbi:MAG: DNA polymerase III subunit alpha [Arenicella sp.]